MRHGSPLPVDAASLKLSFIVVVETLIQPSKRSARQRGEHLSSPRHQRVSPRRAMVLERLAEQCGSRLQNRPAPSGLDKFDFRVAALLQGSFGAYSALEFPPLPLKPVTL